jgi:hypothetical protein
MTDNEIKILLFLLQHDYYNINLSDVILKHALDLSDEAFEVAINNLITNNKYIIETIRPVNVRCFSTNEQGKRKANEIKKEQENSQTQKIDKLQNEFHELSLQNAKLTNTIMNIQVESEKEIRQLTIENFKDKNKFLNKDIKRTILTTITGLILGALISILPLKCKSSSQKKFHNRTNHCTKFQIETDSI